MQRFNSGFRIGVVIGTFGSTPHVHLLLESLKRHCPECPVLVHDDCSPQTERLAELSWSYGASFSTNSSRLGHILGDLSAFSNGLLWARNNGCDMLIKISRRFCPTDNRFIRELREIALRDQLATYSNICAGFSFGFRTECVGLHTNSWLPRLNDFLDRIQFNDLELPESYFYEAASNIDKSSEPFGWWTFMGNSRRVKWGHHLWHDSHEPEDYHELAKAWGLSYRPQDFKIPPSKIGNKPRQNLILTTTLPPGDCAVLTATIYSLHAQFPHQFYTDVRSNHNEIFQFNPHVTKLNDGEKIEMHYPLISKSNTVPASYLHGFAAYLGSQLEIPLSLQTNRPHLFVGPDEKPLLEPGTYFLISPGLKDDFPLKSYPVEYYQNIIDELRGEVNFVQIGRSDHNHPRLNNCMNLVGKTSLRQLIVLAKHCIGGLGPSTLLQHLCAAWEKPYVLLLGGTEARPWQDHYPCQHTYHTIGLLDCCASGSCGKTTLGDCKYPVLDFSRPSPMCMSLIQPSSVVQRIRLIKTRSYPSVSP